MPYQKGTRLPAEGASRLGHLDVLKSPLVTTLYKQFESGPAAITPPPVHWQPLPQPGPALPIVFGVDGSIQTIRSDDSPAREMSFVKTALFRLDTTALAKLDARMPHPLALRDLMEDAALYHATVFPLKHMTMPGQTVRDTVRQVIFESLQDASLQGQVLDTLRWLAYEEWESTPRQLDLFECPHCRQRVATLPPSALQGSCPSCGGPLYLSDWLGFHLDMSDDAAPEGVASAYMGVHETLLLFMAIRYFWEHLRSQISECLWIKDGPLALYAQYAKLIFPIRKFLAYARDHGYPIHLVGQEKSGAFFDHLALVGPYAPTPSILVPTSAYINTEVRRSPNQAAPYGESTNYGAKVFLKLRTDHMMVLAVPTGRFVPDPVAAYLIGLDRIVGTLPSLLGHLYENSLIPIERAHAVASLSTYPSAAMLKVFAGNLAHVP